LLITNQCADLSAHHVIDGFIDLGIFLQSVSKCCDTLDNVGWISYLTFDYVITSHQFFPSEYFKPIPKDKQKLHNEIKKLHELGWGYTKIHRHLRENGFQIGKSRTTVDKILKKMKKKHEYLSQPIIDGIGNFRVEMKKV
jgi:hypothetical protein|tara:strand:+ start:168 stop:587 length:420 start_codon:yes stop_codon:yes gene_type:complete